MTPANPPYVPAFSFSPPRYTVIDGRATEVQPVQNSTQSTSQPIYSAIQLQFPQQFGYQIACPTMQPQVFQLQFIPPPQPQYVQPPTMQQYPTNVPMRYLYQYPHPTVVNNVQQYVSLPPVPMPQPSCYKGPPSEQSMIVAYPNGQQSYVHQPGGMFQFLPQLWRYQKNG